MQALASCSALGPKTQLHVCFHDVETDARSPLRHDLPLVRPICSAGLFGSVVCLRGSVVMSWWSASFGEKRVLVVNEAFASEVVLLQRGSAPPRARLGDVSCSVRRDFCMLNSMSCEVCCHGSLLSVLEWRRTRSDCYFRFLR